MTATTYKRSKTIFPRKLIGEILNGITPNDSGYARDSDSVSVMKAAKAKGLECLGSGAYSVVVEHPHDPKKVIKVTTAKADGYHHYVEWVSKRANKELPKKLRKHLPVVYDTKVINGIRVTILERLKKTGEWMFGRTKPTFVEVQDRLLNLAEDLGLNDDMGGQNTMLRGKTPVITDPWSHDSDHQPACYDEEAS